MSQEVPLSVDRLLAELKASLSEPSGEAALRRINAERLLHLKAEEFIEAHQAERIRILPDRRVAGEPEADLLLQIDDYDIRLVLLDAPGGKPTLAADQLSQLLGLLGNNPSTIAVVLVWTTDALLSLPLKVPDIQHLLENPDGLSNVLSSAKPLLEVLHGIVGRQTKDWEAGLDATPRPAAMLGDSRRLFEAAYGKAVETERRRSYKSTVRKEAAQDFPFERERQVIMETLEEALNGESSESLRERLTKLPRRGRP